MTVIQLEISFPSHTDQKSDGRMSGTAAGTVVLHVSPEAAIKSSIFSVVKTGDLITLDLTKRSLDVQLHEDEINRRLRERTITKTQACDTPFGMSGRRGYRALYARSVNQAHEGADFDFLTASGSQHDL